MPGFAVHLGAVVTCMHGGQAQPAAPNPRVLVSGQPVSTLASPYVVAGCPFVPPAAGPCVSAQWVSGATRVFVGGAPLVVQSSQAVCVPTGTGLLVIATQTRVLAT
ncbi:MAG TPA: hypothetical protein VIR57_17620 [Chloroflexota bacterium]|jgi:hypothetical protein